MIKFIFLSIVIVLYPIVNFGQAPLAPAQPVMENFCGQAIEDTYRNLENLEDPEVQNWLKAQGNHASSVLKKISKRQYLIDKQKEFDTRIAHEISWQRITEKDQYFYLKRMPGENVAKLYFRQGFSGEEIFLYDPKDYQPASNNTFVINYIKPDWAGEKIAISLSKNGEEISEMVIFDRTTKALLPDRITNCWPADGGGVNWHPDNSGFYYLHYPVIDRNSDLFLKNMSSVFYKIGQTNHLENEVFSKANNPELNIQSEDFPMVSIKNTSDHYILATVGGATRFRDTYYAKLRESSFFKYDWTLLFSKVEKVTQYIVDGEDFIYLSGKNSSNYQLCKTSLEKPNFESPEILVDHKADEVITEFSKTSDGLFFVRNKNGVESKLYYLKDGQEKEIELPKKSGSVYVRSKGAKYPDLTVYIMGWTSNFRSYKFDVHSNTFEEFSLTPIPEYPEFDDLVVEEVLVTSHDGVEVPLSLIYKKGLALNGKNPVLFYGYGAYGSSMNPFFSPSFLLFASEGGIVAIAHVRGGGEKGVAWHEAGRKETKPNTWKDLIACTEYMIKEKYTSNQHTAIWSASAGGILVGRAMTERPDLYAVAIPEVGMMNTLRFEQTPNGANNVKEFGAIENPEECKALYEMDAYLHLKPDTQYPSTLITAGINDPRVIVWQPAKFAAKLQACQSSKHPILFLVNYDSGHGAGDTVDQQYESIANVYSFAFWQMKHPEYVLEE
ncbi:MAG: prolyl oligopeptidase family serine peptidase [Bacteroidota bacterium]